MTWTPKNGKRLSTNSGSAVEFRYIEKRSAGAAAEKWVQTHEIPSARGKAHHDPVKRGTRGIKVGIWSDECHVQHQTPLPLQSDQPDALGNRLTVHTDHRLSQHFHTLGRSSAHANV